LTCEDTQEYLAVADIRASPKIIQQPCVRCRNVIQHNALGARFGTRDSGGVVSFSCCDGLVYLLGYTGSA
jgi:hypothetical protein